MSRVKLLIVEDEMIIANDMKLMLEAVGYEVCGVARTPEKARALLAATPPDLVLLDIHLGSGTDGIALGRELLNTYRLPFIFCTSYSDSRTVAEAKEVRPNGYLLKPFTKDDLFVAVEIALQNFASSPPQSTELLLGNSLFVKEGNMFTKVLFDEVLYVEQDRNYVDICTAERRHPVRSTLKDFAKNLPRGTFIQVHRSFIVNTSYISSVNADVIRLGDKEIPIGQTYREELLRVLRLMS